MSRIFQYKNSAPLAPQPSAPTAMIFSYATSAVSYQTIGYDKDFQQVWSNKHVGLETIDAAILPDGTHYLLQESTDNPVVVLKKYSPTHNLIFEKVIEDIERATSLDYDLASEKLILTTAQGGGLGV